MIDYVETMDKLFRSADPTLKGTYHRDFAQGCMQALLKTDDGTRMFYTTEEVNDLYFWHIRPAAIYLNWVIDLPPFLVDAKNYQGGPIVRAKDIQRHLDGLLVDTEEITKHDFGHTFLMKRQDTWLFETSGLSRLELVSEWTQNKNSIYKEWERLGEKDPTLAKAVRFLVSEVIHDRGYQFHLPILRQQFHSSKWIEILRFKKKHGYFGDNGPTVDVEERLNEGRLWLVAVVERMLIENNLQKIARLKEESAPLILKRWRLLENYTGTPVQIEARDLQNFIVSFDVPEVGHKCTSLYEIALVLAPTAQNPIFTAEKVDYLERWLWQKRHSNAVNSLQLTQNGEVIASLKSKKELREPPKTLPSDEKLSKIELYKLERLLNLMVNETATPFTVTHLPETFSGKVIDIDRSKKSLTFFDNTAREHKLDLKEISFQTSKKIQGVSSDKYINLDSQDRFVDEAVLRRSYLHYDESMNVTALPYITIDNRFELGIVDTNDPKIARAVSSLLTRSLEDAKYTNGGYLPPKIVERVQMELVSPYAISNLWGKTGHRFVLSRECVKTKREIISTALVAYSRDGIFFFTSKFNNLRHSTLGQDIDFECSADCNPNHKWFDKFRYPDIDDYKPKGFHHFANFVVEKEGMRGQGISRLMIQEIIKNYSRDYIQLTKSTVKHSQRLLCGKGFWQIGDPPWLARMERLGFFPRLGSETFHINVDWDPLIPTYNREGQILDHITYNQSFGMPLMYTNLLEGKESRYRNIYEEALRTSTTDHLINRIPEVIDLAKSGKAKLQYFQLMFPFEHLANDLSNRYH